MVPYIHSGDLVTVTACDEYKKGDIVLCCVKGNDYLHIVKDIKDHRYLIGNAHGGLNGWVGIIDIYGKLTEVKK